MPGPPELLGGRSSGAGPLAGPPPAMLGQVMGPPEPPPTTPLIPLPAPRVERQASWEDLIRAEAKRQGVPAALALALAEQESGFNPAAQSGKGARGLMQLMPQTAADLGVDPDDPIQNIQGGMRYLKQQLDAHNGNVRLALAAYNAGPQAVADAGGDVPQFKETQEYVQKIMGQGLPKWAGQAAPGQPSAPGGIVQTAASAALGPPALQSGGRASGAGSGPSDALMRRQASQSQQASALPGQSVVDAMITGFDPTRPQGRRNIAGAAGAIGATALTGGGAGVAGLAGLAMRTIPPILGAATGGAAAETGEAVIGRHELPSARNIAGSALEQGVYEGVGQAVAWPFKAVGRRLIAGTVSKDASTALKTQRESVTRQLDSALGAADEALTRTRGQAGEALATARDTKAAMTGEARETAQAGVQTARTAAKERLAAHTEKVKDYRPNITPQGAGERVGSIAQGPAKNARDAAGQAVDEAAKSGPAIDIKALKAEAQRILTEELTPSAVEFPRQAAGDHIPTSAESNYPPIRPPEHGLPGESAEGAAVRAAQKAALASSQAAIEAEQAAQLIRHPALGVVNRILNASDTVSFEAAHKFKRELNDAVTGTWDAPVKKRVTAITQHLSTTLRQTIADAGHAPYEEATSQYKRIVPLYTTGYAKSLRKLAIEEPAAIVHRISGKAPHKALMLRELLTTQAHEGGAGAEGQKAWDAVRSAWTYEKVVQGDIRKLADRVAKLDPDFVEVMYGDRAGREVYGNLQTISTTLQSILEQNATEIAAAKQTGQAGVMAATRKGAQQVGDTRRMGEAAITEAQETLGATRAARTAAKAPTATEDAFQKSSLHRAPTAGSEFADAARAVALGPGNWWGATSLARLVKGPKMAELVQWSAYSSARTQVLVKALTSPAPGLAIADLLRSMDVGGVIRSVTTAPPPAPSRAVGAGPRAQGGGPPPLTSGTRSAP